MLNFLKIKNKQDESLKSERLINRRSINRDTLNERQVLSCNLIIFILNLEKGESKTKRENNINYLQLLIGKWGSGKSYVLNLVILLLKNLYRYKDDNYLIIVSTGKIVLGVCNSTMNLYKYRLSLPIRGKLKKLQGKE